MSADQELAVVANARWEAFEREKLAIFFKTMNESAGSVSKEEVTKIETTLSQVVKSAFYNGFTEGATEMQARAQATISGMSVDAIEIFEKIEKARRR